MGYYLLEIGVEELPAHYIDIGIKYLINQTETLLNNNSIRFGSIKVGGTPRRLYLFIDNLAENQDSLNEEISGPPVNIAFDTNGKLTKAGLGFIKSKGIKEEDIKIAEGAKGKYIVGIRRSEALKTAEILPSKIEELILSIPFPKTMIWDSSHTRFARPIRWLLSLYNGTHLPIKIGEVKSTTNTYGHRFLSPHKIDIDNYTDYVEKLKNAYVIVNEEERKNIIKTFLNSTTTELGIVYTIDYDLLNTVANLVEYPYPIVSNFDEHFLELPEEVLITTMKNHQKFFYLKDNTGKITTYFVGVSNTKPVTNDSLIKNGYNKVLKARLTDALFFYKNDQKKPLIDRLEMLKNIIFQENLGTLYNKTERLLELSQFIADEWGFKGLKENIKKAAQLSKCDLTTEMVTEFPELQGIMGKVYAKIEGIHENIAQALYEQYLPRFAGDKLPETIEGTIISIADKLDTIAGNFATNFIPTGDTDPYGLRRKAIGIIEILLYKNINADIEKLVNKALFLYLDLVSFDLKEITASIIDFIKQRLKQKLINERISPDSFDAALKYNKILSLQKAALAINELKNSDNFRIIALSYKRINNILSKNKWNQSNYNVDLLTENYEKALHKLIKEYKLILSKLIEEDKFSEALNKLSELSEPLKLFFDNVLVMAEDEKIKNNRLSLLKALKDMCNNICDLSKLIY